jgi:hypothetical protein
MFHGVDREHRVGLGVDAAVVDVDAGVAEQVLEQQRSDGPERPLDRLFVRGRSTRAGRTFAPRTR